MLRKVLVTVENSECRSGIHKTGERFIVDEVCPPMCHELWNNIYPMLYALGNGAKLESGSDREESFTAVCPDGGRVKVRAELLSEDR